MTPDEMVEKNKAGKPMCDLLDGGVLEEMAAVMTLGAVKYVPDAWREGVSIRKYLAALLRHVFAILRGEDDDPETGHPHSIHAMCCLMIIRGTLRDKPERDDRWGSSHRK